MKEEGVYCQEERNQESIDRREATMGNVLYFLLLSLFATFTEALPTQPIRCNHV